MLPGPIRVSSIAPVAPQVVALKSVLNLKLLHCVPPDCTVKDMGWLRLVVPSQVELTGTVGRGDISELASADPGESKTTRIRKRLSERIVFMIDSRRQNFLGQRKKLS